MTHATLAYDTTGAGLQGWDGDASFTALSKKRKKGIKNHKIQL
jgi:hypothetical protein